MGAQLAIGPENLEGPDMPPSHDSTSAHEGPWKRNPVIRQAYAPGAPALLAEFGIERKIDEFRARFPTNDALEERRTVYPPCFRLDPPRVIPDDCFPYFRLLAERGEPSDPRVLGVRSMGKHPTLRPPSRWNVADTGAIARRGRRVRGLDGTPGDRPELRAWVPEVRRTVDES